MNSAIAIAVNSYITGWGWQSDQLIDAPVNTFPPMKYVKNNNTNTKNLRVIASERVLKNMGADFAKGFQRTTGSYQLRQGVPNIIKTQWMNWDVNPSFSYILDSTQTASINVSILRDITGPFIRLEPYSDPARTGKKTYFADARFLDFGDFPYSINIIGGGSPKFVTESTDKLASPGSSGYAILTNEEIRVHHIDTSIWNIATFVFRLDVGIVPVGRVQRILYFGSWTAPYWNPSRSGGFELVITSGSTSAYSVGIQTFGVNGFPNNKVSTTISLNKTQWYIAEINKTSISVKELVQTDVTWSVGSSQTLQIPTGSMPIPYSKPSDKFPRINIGGNGNSIPLHVAWLHFFDNSIESVDLNKELIGYAPGGYTGIY